jgi:NADH dehydrogenase
MVDVIETDACCEANLKALLPGHDAVVNLIAVLHGDARRFEAVHVEWPRTLARSMTAAGVQRLVHISALGASEQGPSLYLSSKGRGEAVLRDAGLVLTILRPSVIFGPEDKFLNLFARLQQALPIVPLAGADTRFQPVWVGDVAQAVVKSLQTPGTIGKTIECTGPQTLTLADIVRLAGRLSGNPRPVIGLPRAMAYFQALFMECLPGEPLMSTDNLRSLEVDSVASGSLPTLDALGIQPQAVEAIAAMFLDASGQADPLLQVRERAGRAA